MSGLEIKGIKLLGDSYIFKGPVIIFSINNDSYLLTDAKSDARKIRHDILLKPCKFCNAVVPWKECVGLMESIKSILEQMKQQPSIRLTFLF